PYAYRGSPECIIIQPAPLTGLILLRGLDRVATNRPGYLVLGNRPPGLMPMARFPGDRDLLFAAGRICGDDGRILVLADHSVFINEMMMQRDNDNVYFAYNCIEW